MSLATMFQDKTRELTLATALIIGAAGIYNNNANADTQTVNHSATTTMQAEPDEDFRLAAEYSKQNDTVAVWVCAPMGLDMKPQEIAQLLEDLLKERGIVNVKAFSAVSNTERNRIFVYENGELLNNKATGHYEFTVNDIQNAIPKIVANYKAAHPKRDGD